MPRDKGGIGRTGKKHKKPATHDVYRQLKPEPVEGAAPAASSAEQIAGHHPVPGDTDFKEHSMFCPIF